MVATVSSRRNYALAGSFTAYLLAAFACAPLTTEPGALTSVPNEPSPAAGTDPAAVPGINPNGTTPSVDPNASTGVDTGQGNTIAETPASPNDTPTTTPSTPAPSVTLPAANVNAVYGVGFAIKAVDYPGYCLASSDAASGVGSTLMLASCANSPAQAFYWYKGRFAMVKKNCIQSGASGAAVTLQTCKVGQANQMWDWLSGTGAPLSQSAAGGAALGLSVPAATYQTSPVVAGDNNGSDALRLIFAPLPGSDGVRIHATFANIDRCLVDASGRAAFSECASGGSQVWQVVGGQWRSGNNTCLSGNTATGGLAVVPCSTTPSANMQWLMAQNFLPMASGQPYNPSTSLVMDADGNNGAGRIATPANAASMIAVGCAANLF